MCEDDSDIKFDGEPDKYLNDLKDFALRENTREAWHKYHCAKSEYHQLKADDD